MEKTVNKLPDEVAKKYEVLPGRPYKFSYRNFGRVDLNDSTLQQVEALIKGGVQHIVKKQAKD